MNVISKRYDGNGSLQVETYFMDDSYDTNATIPYNIEGSRVYMTENNTTVKCRVEDHNDSYWFHLSSGVAHMPM